MSVPAPTSGSVGTSFGSQMRPITASLLQAIADEAIKFAGTFGDARAAAERVTHEFLDKLGQSAPSNLHVMVVDDDKFIRDTVSRMLGNCSYSVTVCDSGAKALEVLSYPNHNIDLILADVMMPVMDGFQLLSEIRKVDRYHHIPVVMMSGIDTRDEISKSLAIGADSYLIKPLRMQELKLLWQHVHNKQKEMVFRDLVLNQVMQATAAHVQGNGVSQSMPLASASDWSPQSVPSVNKLSPEFNNTANVPIASESDKFEESTLVGETVPSAVRTETMVSRALQKARRRAEIAEAKLESLLHETSPEHEHLVDEEQLADTTASVGLYNPFKSATIYNFHQTMSAQKSAAAVPFSDDNSCSRHIYLLAGPTPKSAVDSAVEPEPEVHPLLLMPAAALMKVTPESQRAATLRLTAQVGAVEPESNNEALILQQRIQELEPHAEDIHSLSIIKSSRPIKPIATAPAVVAPAVPLAVVKPQTIICRICERHILSDKLAIHSTRCSVISAWHMQVDLGDESIKNIQRLLQSMMRQRSSSHCKAKMCVAAPKVSIEIEEDTTPVLPAAAVTPVEDQDQNAIDPHVAVVLQYARRLLELLQHAVNIQRQDGQAVKLLGEAQKAAQDILDEWTDAAMDAPEPAEVELVCTPEALYHSVDIAFKEKIMALQKLHDIVGHYYAPQQFDDAVETWMSMHHPLPSMEDFIVLKMISKGAFGSVFLVRHKRTDELMAVKVLRRSDSPKECAAFVKERNLMLLMDHPFLVRLFYSFASAENYYLAMEFLSGGDCFSLLQSIGFVDEGLAKVYVAELVLAIHHLHRRGVVHRDIKPDNILIGQDGHVRLTDFGLSRLELVDMSLGVCPYFTDEYTEQATKDQTPVLSARPWRRFSQVGTPDYLAPEILLKSAYGPCVDWWALGVVIFELLVGNTPFDDVSTDKIYDNILHGRVRWPNVPSEMSVAAKDLISGLLSLSPADRLGANGIESIQRHPFFAGVDWNSLNASHSKFLPDLDDPTDTRYFDGRNAVFYSDLEVSFSGSRLDQVHLGSGGEAAATAADQDEDEDAVFRRLPYMGKAFWNLHALNMRATGGARSNVMD